MSLEREVAELMHSWARKGGKKNRQVQVKRLLMFARDLDAIPGGPRSLGEVGRRQAIRWYRSLEHSGRSPTTVSAHAYALRALWSRLGRDPAEVIYRDGTGKRQRGRRGSMRVPSANSFRNDGSRGVVMMTRKRDQPTPTGGSNVGMVETLTAQLRHHD